MILVAWIDRALGGGVETATADRLSATATDTRAYLSARFLVEKRPRQAAEVA